MASEAPEHPAPGPTPTSRDAPRATWKWRRRRTVAALLALPFLTAAEASPVAADGTVHDLGASNFSAAVSRSGELSFVEFYAPWCGHCKKLVPEWEKTAELVQQEGILVAKVDSIAEKALAQEHEVQSFPTLKLFRGGAKVSVKYEGPRTASKMAEWAKGKQNEDLVRRLPSAAGEVTAWAAAKPVAVVGLLEGMVESSVLDQVLEDVSFALNPASAGGDVPVGLVESAGASLMKGLGAGSQKTPCVALLRNFDFEEKVLFFTPETSWPKSYDALMSWIAAKRVPALIPGSEKTEKFFLQDIDPGNALVLYFGEDDQIRKDMHGLAVSFGKDRKLKWVHLPNGQFAESLGKNVGLTKADFPEVAIWEFGESEDTDKVYRLSQQPSGAGLSRSAVEAFVKDWQQGRLSAEKDPVVSLTSDTFDSLVINNDKDVLVEFYAPWCGHCKALAPEYKLVAQHYAQDEGVAIVKMDSTQHKHSSADIKSYPTLKLYAKGKKSAPIDAEFKTTRTKDGILDFIEQNRASTKKGGKGGSKPKDAGAELSKTDPPVKAAADTSPPKPPQGAKGVWLFDDSTDPKRREQELSEDMVESRKGYTLVQVASVGLLLSPDGSARAVRNVPSKAAFVSSLPSETGQSGGAGGAPAGNLPCPADANLHSCKAWCEGVVPGEGAVRSTLGGKKCSELSPTAAVREQPSCICYDPDYKMQLATCPGAAAPPPEAGTCAAGDKACAAAAQGLGEGQPRRFLLYDTKYGEGFNLQREVYPRAGWVVAEANKALAAKCGAETAGDCARWVLVLPPWCQVVHWWTGPEHVYWRTFFDSGALAGSKVPVIEFHEYERVVGQQSVDMVVSFETDQLKSQKEKLSGGKGKFMGFAPSISDCKTKYVKPLEFRKLPSGDLEIVYAGHCDGAIAAKELRCASLDGPWPQGVVDLILTLTSKVGSVLLKNYDYLLAPDNEQLDELGLRESMLFAPELRDHAEEFIRTALLGEKYLAAHCRRTDFLRAREKTTPDVSNIASKLNEILEQEGLQKVFIATDAPDDLRAELEKQVNGAVVFYDAKRGAKQFDHKGKQAIVETWIAARADFFVGTIESRFTMSIQLERSFLGKPRRTSEQEFCKEYKSGKPCLAPSYRHTPQRGAHREAYH